MRACGDLVHHADADNLADERRSARSTREQCYGGRAALDASLLQGALPLLNLSARSPS